MKNVVNRALAAKKKALFFLFSALVLCACEGPMGPQGPQGPKGDGTNWKIVDISVPVSKWTYTNFDDGGFNNYYYSRWAVPELTSFVFTDGNVQGYIYLKEGDELIQHDLPYVLHKEVVNDQGQQTNVYTTTVDFVYGVGWVQLEVRDSDFEYEVDTSIKPGAMDFRIVMTW